MPLRSSPEPIATPLPAIWRVSALLALIARLSCGVAICFLLLILAPSLQAQLAQSSNRECATCHVMWLNEFRREDLSTLIPFNIKMTDSSATVDMVSTEKMCFSCHDGYVMDSRPNWSGAEHSHPVGVKPSDDIHIPTIDGKKVFPLSDDGKVYCGTCHSAHGVEWGAGGESPIFLRMKNVKSSLCVACHLDRSSGDEKRNHPILADLDSKTPPAALVKAGAKFSDNQVTCQSCHIVHTARNEHLLVVENDQSQLCGTCHTDLYPREDGESPPTPSHPVNVMMEAGGIPTSLIEAGGKAGPSGQIICQTCHRPHDALEDENLLVKANTESMLCRSCHEEQEPVVNSKHNMTLADEQLVNVKDQPVGEAGSCSACHLPHGGTGPKMWARAISGTGDTMAAQCLGCHDAQGIAHEYRVGTFSHPVGQPFSRLKRTPDLPGYDEQGRRVEGKEARVTCASCHNPHQWDPDHPQMASKPGDKGDSSNLFLRMTDVSGSGLCLACHGEKESVQGTKHDLVAMDIKEANINGDTAAKAGVCSACHIPHNAANSMMWAREIGADKDVISAACLGCHDKDKMAYDKITGDHSHPVNVGLDELELAVIDGQWINLEFEIPDLEPIIPLPLYDEVGHRSQANGLVTCGTCHDPHRWSINHSKADGVDIEGDGQSSFLRMAYTDSADFCVNCHRRNATVAFSKHNLHTDEGVCRSCHKPHNGTAERIWAREVSGDTDGPQQLCLSCHKERLSPVISKCLTSRWPCRIHG